MHNRSFRLLLGALAVSQLGDWLYNVALLAYIYQETHSAIWMSLTTFARVLPIVLLGPVAGMLGDRFDRRLVMIGSDLARVATMLGLVAVTHYGLPIVLVPALAATSTVLASPYPGCVAASLPRLLTRDELPAANAARAAIGPLAIIVGPIIGAGVLVVAGASWVFGVNALTFAASALLVLSVSDRGAFRPTRTEEHEPSGWAALSFGARELLRRPSASRLVAADTISSLSYGVLSVTLVTVSTRLGWHESGYGVLLAGLGAGAVLGAAIAPRLLRRGDRRSLWLAIALLTVAVTLPLIGLLAPAAAVLAMVLACGAGGAVLEVGAETVLQEELPDEVFARAYGFAYPVSIGAVALGALVAAPLCGLLGLTGALLAIGLPIAGYGAWFYRSAGVSPARPPQGLVDSAA